MVGKCPCSASGTCCSAAESEGKLGSLDSEIGCKSESNSGWMVTRTSGRLLDELAGARAWGLLEFFNSVTNESTERER